MRYLPLEDYERQTMLEKIGVAGVDALFRDVPDNVPQTHEFDLPNHIPEMWVERHMRHLADENTPAASVPFFVGAGAYKHHVPATVDHLIQRGEFLTAYTPYQPEISQGTLQVLFEFQSQVAQLTGMEVANASLYDGSTGCAEAIFMARRLTRKTRAVISGNLHPHYVEVAKTNAQFTEDELDVVQCEATGCNIDTLIAAIDDKTSCVVVQNPDVFGHVADLRPLADAAHAKGALLVVVVTEAVSMGAMMSPGEMGADIVVGEGQSIGVGLNFGGPYLGLFATRQKFVRQLPGRICGETVDADGRRGYVLTLSTREQHIRREKATSNICTNSGLCALAFSIHMSLLGEAGLRKLARLNHKRACQLKMALEGAGFDVLNTLFFNEITVDLGTDAAAVVDGLAEKDVLAGVPASRLYPGGAFDNHLIMAATEMASESDIAEVVGALKTQVLGELS